jgi:exocyst complex component 4
MLDNLPHDQAFSRLLITQIVTYYDKCYGWYKGTTAPSRYTRLRLTDIALVARTQPHPQSGKRLKLSAALTEADELKIIVDQLMTADVDKRRELIEKVCVLYFLRVVMLTKLGNCHHCCGSGWYHH